MSSTRLAFSSSSARPLSALEPGARGTIVAVACHPRDRAERLFALGVTRGVSVMLLQSFPSLVFQCDQTELAIERVVADVILVQIE